VQHVGRLVLLRHAKSSWDDPTLADRDRPLARRGVKASAAVAPFVGPVDVVLCSPARRTRATLDAVPLEKHTTVLLEEELYGATAGELLVRIRMLPHTAKSVLVVGHNPGLEDLALGLAGTVARSDDLRALESKFPTAALAIFDTGDTPWSSLGWGQATLTAYVTPARLRSP
jgi:phosphohistidine phosphatase